jgi:hypothetical protein
MKRLAAAALFSLLAGAAAVQAQMPPYVYPITLGTTQVQVLPMNPLRKRLIIVNPNATALVAVCPAGPARGPVGGAAVVATINGPGCLTLLPYDQMTVDAGLSPGPVMYMDDAWIGIANAAGSALTIWEFE